MKINNLRKVSFVYSIVAFTLFLMQSGFIYAADLPDGATVVNGNVSITSVGNTMGITASDKSVINWNSYNIGQANTVNYVQPSSSSVVLNRVVGVDPSSILGTLNANGRVFIVNPNGIFFGPHSQVNVNSLVASTNDISNNDFINGNYNFTKNGKSAWIINQGNIHIANGGYVLLLSQAINNSGVIEAQLGRVVLATGEKIAVIGLDDDNTISVNIDGAVSNGVFGPDGARITQSIVNTGTINADGGSILLNAKILNGIFDNAINNSGVVQANSLVNNNGSIEIVADGGNTVFSTGSVTSAKAAGTDGQGGWYGWPGRLDYYQFYQ